MADGTVREIFHDRRRKPLAAFGHPKPRRFAEALLFLPPGAAVAADLDHSDDAGDIFLEAWHAFIEASVPGTCTSAPARGLSSNLGTRHWVRVLAFDEPAY